MKSKLIILILFIIAIFLTLFVPNLSGSNIKKSKLYISEVLPSNSSIILDDDLNYSDYIEIYNGYKTSINFKGYYLSDSEYNTSKWQFPDIEIKPNEYLIVYASGKDKCDKKNRICHTNFKLSKTGEVISLSDRNGNIISKVSYSDLIDDVSIGYVDSKYTYVEPSPNKKNKKTEFNIGGKYKIRINEYLVSNKGSGYNSEGIYYDWVELYNYSDKDINLKNLYISDNKNKLTKYKLPDKVLKKGEYIVIYLSGNNEYKNDEIHANFKLSSKDKVILISNGKEIIDSVKIVDLNPGVSYGYSAKEWLYYPTPTPGYENDTAGFETIGG